MVDWPNLDGSEGGWGEGSLRSQFETNSMKSEEFRYGFADVQTTIF